MANMNFKPTRDWIVLPMQRRDKTEGGIELLDGAANALRTNVLKVLAAGPSCETIKEGMTVMVHPATEGLVVNIDGQERIMINEFSICGIIPDPE
tara:strand:- start:2664 stop:2948 length:285 start_codon:yes stop_codon:yes gene_type:complete